MADAAGVMVEISRRATSALRNAGIEIEAPVVEVHVRRIAKASGGVVEQDASDRFDTVPMMNPISMIDGYSNVRNLLASGE